MKDIRVLIVDDQQFICDSLQIVLSSDTSIKVIGSSLNGEEAINFCEKMKPDLILMDIRMPELDGVAAAERIKKKWPDIKIIMLTSFMEIQYVTEALAVGADGYLLKGITPEQLITGIKSVYAGGTLILPEVAKGIINKISTSSNSSLDQIKRSALKYNLTEREAEILCCIADRLSNKEISQKLFLSEGTVKNYISSIYSKLEVSGRKEIIKVLSDGNSFKVR